MKEQENIIREQWLKDLDWMNGYPQEQMLLNMKLRDQLLDEVLKKFDLHLKTGQEIKDSGIMTVFKTDIHKLGSYWITRFGLRVSPMLIGNRIDEYFRESADRNIEIIKQKLKSEKQIFMKKETHDFRDCHAGDKVTDLIYGTGTIIGLPAEPKELDETMLIRFDKNLPNLSRAFNLRGIRSIKESDGVTTYYPTLYHGHVKLEVIVSEIPLPYKVSELVAVKNSESHEWFIRKYKETLDGNFVDVWGIVWKYHKPLKEFE